MKKIFLRTTILFLILALAHVWSIDTVVADAHSGHEIVFGVVGSLPSSGLLGGWLIDGVEYTATTETVLKQKYGAFAVGVQVKVEYSLDSQNNRIAYQIETWH